MRYPKHRLDLDRKLLDIINEAHLVFDESYLVPKLEFEMSIIDGVKKLIQNNYRRRTRSVAAPKRAKEHTEEHLKLIEILERYGCPEFGDSIIDEICEIFGHALTPAS